MDWVEQFLVDLERKGVSSHTLKNKSYFVRALAERVDFKNCSKEELFEVLDDYRKNSKPSYYRQIVGATKRILKFLGRDNLAQEIQTPRKTDPAGSVKVLSRDEVEKLIKEAPTLRDRLLITILYETGARRGELLNLKMKNVQFDEHGAIVWLSGKSGTRTRRIYGCVPDLRQLINNHPRKNDPETPIFLTAYGEPYTKDTVYKRIKSLGRRILNKEIHPHMLRHTRATEDSRYFTDREMMLLFGWKKADQISVYSHLSMRDVENKDLEIHGLKPRDQTLKPLVNAQKCPNCDEMNAAFAVYCVKCCAVLPNQAMLEKTKTTIVSKDELEELRGLKKFLERDRPKRPHMMSPKELVKLMMTPEFQKEVKNPRYGTPVLDHGLLIKSGFKMERNEGGEFKLVSISKDEQDKALHEIKRMDDVLPEIRDGTKRAAEKNDKVS